MNSIVAVEKIEPRLPLVNGQPYTQLPVDLFIPPEALQVFLAAFEGPLDLLLYLIRKQNLDVLDIPMAELTRQYMAYVDLMQAHQLELVGEYLLMAAMLIDIKSRLLLPRPAAAHAEDENDPRAALVRRLLEYEQIKAAAQRLAVVPTATRNFMWAEVWIDRVAVVRLPHIEPHDLLEAWRGIARRANLFRHHHVAQEGLSVRQRMSHVLRKLAGGAYTPFTDLFDVEINAPELVVTLLAVLELVKESLIDIAQAEAYAPIYVRLKSNHATPASSREELPHVSA